MQSVTRLIRHNLHEDSCMHFNIAVLIEVSFQVDQLGWSNPTYRLKIFLEDQFKFPEILNFRHDPF